MASTITHQSNAEAFSRQWGTSADLVVHQTARRPLRRRRPRAGRRVGHEWAVGQPADRDVGRSDRRRAALRARRHARHDRRSRQSTSRLRRSVAVGAAAAPTGPPRRRRPHPRATRRARGPSSVRAAPPNGSTTTCSCSGRSTVTTSDPMRSGWSPRSTCRPGRPRPTSPPSSRRSPPARRPPGSSRRIRSSDTDTKVREVLAWSWVIGALSLAVTGIIVAAAFATSARRQLVTVGLLSSNGAPEGVIRRSLALQGSWTGLVGSLLGVAAGLVGAHVLRGTRSSSCSATRSPATGSPRSTCSSSSRPASWPRPSPRSCRPAPPAACR